MPTPAHMEVDPTGTMFWDSNFQQWLPIAGHAFSASSVPQLTDAGVNPDILSGAQITAPVASPSEPATPPSEPRSKLYVQMPGGGRQGFDTIDEALNQALKGGGKLVRPDGTLVTPTQFRGGWMADGKPLNVWMGQDWTDPQKQSGPPAFRVKMSDGTEQWFDQIDESLNQALKGGGRIVGPNGQLMTMSEPFGAGGGWLANGRPLNVLMGQGYTPDQAAFYGFGGGGGGDGSGAGYGGYGSLSQGFNEQFRYPELPLSLVAQPFNQKFQSGAQFPRYTAGADLPGFFKSLQTFPGYTPQGPLPDDFAFDTADLYKDPGYQFRLQEGLKALDRQQSAAAVTPMGGRALREVSRYASDYATNEFRDAYQRALMEHNLKLGKSQELYGRGLQDFSTQYGIAQDAYGRDLTAFDRNLGVNRERYARGIQDYDLGYRSAADMYGRDLNEYILAAELDSRNKQRLSDEYQRGYGRAFGEYGTRFDIDRTNKNDIYNRFAGLSGTGQVSAGQLGSLGMNFAGNQGNIMLNNARSLAEIFASGANARAAGRTGSANAWGTAFGNIGRDAGDWLATKWWT